MLSQDEADGNRAPLLISDDSVSSDEGAKLLASDPDAKEEQRKKTIRREQNQLDIEGMNAELDVYKKDIDNEDRWKKEFKEFKNGLMLNRARNLVENTARELYMEGRACENVKPKTILAQPKLTAVVSAMTPKQRWRRLRRRRLRLRSRTRSLGPPAARTAARTRALGPCNKQLLCNTPRSTTSFQ